MVHGRTYHDIEQQVTALNDALDDAQAELGKMKTEIEKLKVDRWAGFSDKELRVMQMCFGSPEKTRLYSEVTRAIKSRQGDDIEQLEREPDVC